MRRQWVVDTRCFRAEEVDESSNRASCNRSAASERAPQATPQETRLSATPEERPQGATTQRPLCSGFHAPSSQPSTTYAPSFQPSLFSPSAASPSPSPSPSPFHSCRRPDPSAQHSGATCGQHRVGRRCKHRSRGKDIFRDIETQKELVEPCNEGRDSRRCQSTCQYSQHHQAGCAHHVCRGCEQDRFTSNFRE